MVCWPNAANTTNDALAGNLIVGAEGRKNNESRLQSAQPQAAGSACCDAAALLEWPVRRDLPTASGDAIGSRRPLPAVHKSYLAASRRVARRARCASQAGTIVSTADSRARCDRSLGSITSRSPRIGRCLLPRRTSPSLARPGASARARWK